MCSFRYIYINQLVVFTGSVTVQHMSDDELGTNKLLASNRLLYLRFQPHYNLVRGLVQLLKISIKGEG